MGNALRKPSNLDSIDGGATRQRERPTGVAGEYDAYTVQRLIFAKRLAPFYEGAPESTDPVIELADTLSSTTLATASPTAKIKRSFFARKRRETPAQKEALAAAVQLIISQAQVECPICFLVSPPPLIPSL